MVVIGGVPRPAGRRHIDVNVIGNIDSGGFSLNHPEVICLIGRRLEGLMTILNGASAACSDRLIIGRQGKRHQDGAD